MTDKLLPDVIAPEGLQIAEAYLMCQGDSKKVAHELGLPTSEVDAQLKNREVRAYIDRQYNEAGFRNKFRIGGLMDAIINKKLEEMDETGLGSTMDIAELLKLQHKMNMDQMKAEIELEKAKSANKAPTNQTNVQNNFTMGDPNDENYQNLMRALTQSK